MDWDRLSLLESAARPAELLSDLGRATNVRNGELISDCPACGLEMRVLPSGFLCDNDLCLFRAGSVVEFLGVLRGKLEAGVRETLRMYADKLQVFQSIPEETLVRDLVGLVRAKRALFDFFVGCRHAAQDPTMRDVRAQSWLLQWRIDLTLCRSTLYLARDEQLQALMRLCGALGATLPRLPESEVVMMPLYGNHHTVSDVILLTKKDKQAVRINCAPFRFAFSGLMDCVQGWELRLCSNPIDAAIHSTHYRQYAPGTACCGLIYNSTGSMVGYIPRKAVYDYLPGAPVSALAAFAQACPAVRVKSDDVEITPLAIWAEFVVQEAARLLRKHRALTPEVCLFLNTSKLGPAEQAGIIQLLVRDRMGTLATELEEYFKAAPVYQADRISLYETPRGYVLKRRDELQTSISNFTVRLHTNLTFTDSADLFHVGDLQFDDQHYPLMLNNRALEQPRDLEMAVRAANPSRHSSVPMISDRTGGKHVLAHLRQRAFQLPRVEGISRLGWGLKRDCFYGPSWLATADGVQEPERVFFHPGSAVLSNYSPAAADLPSDGVPPPALRDIIAQCVAMVARAYFDLPVRPINVLNNAHSRDILHQLFAGLGQKELIRLNFNPRTGDELPNCFGFPLYAYGYTGGQLERSKLSAFVLTEDGIPFHGEARPEVLQLAAGRLRQAVQKSCVWLLETAGREFTRCRSINNAAELLQEGQAILQRACNFDWAFTAARFPVLEQFLHTVPAESIGDFFSHHLADQQLFLDTTHLHVDMVSLEMELRILDPSLRKVGSDFVMSALIGNEMLETFYDGRAYPKPRNLDPGSPVEPVVPGVRGLGQQ